MKLNVLLWFYQKRRRGDDSFFSASDVCEALSGFRNKRSLRRHIRNLYIDGFLVTQVSPMTRSKRLKAQWRRAYRLSRSRVEAVRDILVETGYIGLVSETPETKYPLYTKNGNPAAPFLMAIGDVL